MKNLMLATMLLTAPAAFAGNLKIDMTRLEDTGDGCQSSIDLLSGGPPAEGETAAGLEWASCATEFQSGGKTARGPEKIVFRQERGFSRLTVDGEVREAARASLHAPGSPDLGEVIWARHEYVPSFVAGHTIYSAYDRGLRDQACLPGRAVYHFKSRNDQGAREFTVLIGSFTAAGSGTPSPAFILRGSLNNGKIKFTTMCRQAKPLKN